MEAGGWEGAGRVGGKGLTPVLVWMWEAGDPGEKHAAVSCHLLSHVVIEHKVVVVVVVVAAAACGGVGVGGVLVRAGVLGLHHAGPRDCALRKRC